jgi:2,5-furandicarboxylate decarboxylase 1
MIRIQIKGDRQAVVHAEHHHHTGMIIRKYGERELKAPMAVVIGHHPGFYLGSQWEGVFGTREYELCGAALGEPLRLTPSETWGDAFMVPADAEMILECEADWNNKDEEGPVGEYTRHYKNVRGGVVHRNMDPSVELLASTMRGDAHYQSLFIAHAEHFMIGSIPKEAVLYEKIRAVCPGLRQVHLPPSGCGRHVCYLSLEQRVAGEARDAIMAALVGERYLKYVVAVDADVDAFNEAEVQWAVATRTQPDKDCFVVPGLTGSPVDPSIGADGLAAKMGIDATRPFGQPFSEVAEAPEELLRNLRLADYLENT